MTRCLFVKPSQCFALVLDILWLFLVELVVYRRFFSMTTFCMHLLEAIVYTKISILILIKILILPVSNVELCCGIVFLRSSPKLSLLQIQKMVLSTQTLSKSSLAHHGFINSTFKIFSLLINRNKRKINMPTEAFTWPICRICCSKLVSNCGMISKCHN